MTNIKITYGGETVILTANLADASAPLVVDGSEIGRRTVDARHRTDLAVAIAAASVWPEGEWPKVSSTGAIADDWSEGCEAWDDLEYATVDEDVDEACDHNRYEHDECLDCGAECTHGAEQDGHCYDVECPLHGAAVQA